MKFAVLQTMNASIEHASFYNTQEIGLTKALGKAGYSATCYKTVTNGSSNNFDEIKLDDNCNVKYIPAKFLGVNGIFNLNIIDSKTNVLIYFSDTQLLVPYVHNWCKKNEVLFIPYIGTVESHSKYFLYRKMMNLISMGNMYIYKKCKIMAKTPYVEKKLIERGIDNVFINPVGLDSDFLNPNFESADKLKLRNKIGLNATDIVILYIGKLVEEKKPLDALKVFKNLNTENSNYKLLMIGNGILDSEVKKYVLENSITECVKIIPAVKNNEIWKYHHLSDIYINMSRVEIFGMAMLEAMYYKTSVYAINAPGPSYIIQDNITGYLCDNTDEMYTKILQNQNVLISDNGHNYICNNFMWKQRVNNLVEQIRDLETF